MEKSVCGNVKLRFNEMLSGRKTWIGRRNLEYFAVKLSVSAGEFVPEQVVVLTEFVQRHG